jgi:hypothetical protein
MGDREANEGQAAEFTRLIRMEEDDVDEMELQTVTTADSSDGSVNGTKDSTTVYQSTQSVFQENDTDAGSNRDIGESMSWQGSFNQPNAQGYTKICRDLIQFEKTCVGSILKHPSAHRLHLDYCPGDRDSTGGEIIIQKYPDLQPLLPVPLIESLDSSDRDIKLLAALRQRHNTTCCTSA